MRRALGILAVACVLSACGPGALVGRSDVLKKASHEKGVSHLQRSEAKLMSWDQFLQVSQVKANAQDRPPGRQKVWVVAEAGELRVGTSGAREHWAIFVYNAVTGSLIGFIPGPSSQDTLTDANPEWPDYWSRFPDASS